MQRALRITAVTTTVMTFALVVLGSTVRVTESGMGCASWPLCNGHLGLVGTLPALLEQGHRYLAGIVSISVAVVAFFAWRSRAGRRVVAAALTALGLIVLQVVLGAVTVFTHNAPPTVALHLIGGLLLLGAATVTSVACFVPGRAIGEPAVLATGTNAQDADPAARPGKIGWAALAATFATIAAGTGVVDSGASRSCPSWPWCTARAGTTAALVAAQLTHRMLAGIAGVLLGVWCITILARRRARRRARPVSGAVQRRHFPWESSLAWAVGILVVSQVAAGAATALTSATKSAQDVHLAIGAALWTCVVALVAWGTYVSADARNSEVLAGTANAATLARR